MKGKLFRGFESLSLRQPSLTDLIGARQLESAPLLELLGEAEIARETRDQAAGRGCDLAALAAACGCRVASARGQRLEGLAVAHHDAAAAGPRFDRALATFTELGMPYEAARTQAAIAESFRQIDPEVAVAEARNALIAFERLGAAGDADMTARLLRELGVRAARAGTKGFGDLTKREREVLHLLGEGLSNPEIAERLFVSRKTVEHHVAHILDKIGVKSRAQAAAEAVRRLNAESASK